MEKSQEIKRYVESINPAIFGVDRVKNIEIETLPRGNWNFNYVVKINDRKFVFKLYSPNIKGLMFENSGKNEFLALNLVKELGISPKSIHFDESCKFFNYSVLIYEYAEGERLTFSNDKVKEVAKIFAKIHSLDINKIDFIEEKSHDVDELMKEIENSFEYYKKRNDAKQEEIELFNELIEKAKKHASKIGMGSYPKSLIHTDPVPSNFIVGDKISLIDWQRPIISDPAFDVWAFLSEPYNLWDLSETLTDEQKELFLHTYLKLRNDETLKERIKQKEPLYLLQLGLYCLTRYSDYKSGKISDDVLKGREANFERYGRTKEVIVNKLKEVLK